ncbi:MAG: phage tail protein [Anaeromyxobacteraceae bacterium]
MKQLMLAAVALAIAGTAQAFELRAAQPAAEARAGYGASRFVLELDGHPVGFLRSVAGGDAVAAVVTETPGPNRLSKKHLGNFGYDDLVLEVGADLPPELAAWIRSTLAGTYTRKSGAIVGTDFNGAPRWRRTFTDALVTGLLFPALDASSREAFTLGVVITPDLTRLDRKVAATRLTVPGSKRSTATVGYFAITVGNLDTSRVSRVEAFAVSLVLSDGAVGETRDYERTPAKLVVPDLLVTMSDARADGWWAWFDDFVVKGLSTDDKEVQASIAVLDGKGAAVLRLDLDHVGISSLRFLPAGAGEDGPTRDQARLYAERVALTLP